VPRAIVLTMFVLIAVYLGLSVTALSAITPHDLGTKYVLNPVAGIVEALPLGKHFLLPCISVLAAVVLTVAANAGLMGSSRLSFNMGEYYQLPRIFYRLHPRFRTPIVSLAFFTVVASFIILASQGNLDFLADLYNFGAMLAFTSAHLSLLVLRIKKPHLKRPFKIPFNIKIRGYEIPVTAIIGCMATVSVWFLVIITKRDGRYLGLAWMALGMAMYFYYRKAKKMRPTGHVEIEQVKVPGYKPMNVRKILVPTRGGMQTETVQMACEVAKAHGAKVTAVQVIEIASSLPLDIEIPHRIAAAEAILKRAEAIAQDLNVEIELKLVRSRSIPDTILELLQKGRYDLLVLGALKSTQEARQKGLGAITERILKEAPCRVWVCASEAERVLKG
ncbi:MAG: universal stress protein, partial [Verrucomicrobia bacterium]|nr:universal stress protein [Verrucomicrobiota bacterium]